MAGSQKKVIVVGGGNAALCAAIAARDEGADVLVLERAPERLKGGNTAFTAGAMRVAYKGVADLRRLMPDLSQAEVDRADFGSYTEADFLDDLARLTEYRTDPTLADILVRRSFETLAWMRTHGIRFVPIFGRQAFEVDGRFRFWGGLTVEVSGGGRGLVETLTRAVRRKGIEIRYGARANSLIEERGQVRGVTVREHGESQALRADAVILACGGFQANTEWRTRYLGTGWDLAKVRGSMYDTGDGIRMALNIGASPAGNWSGCHAVAWDRNAPEFGDLNVGDQFQKHSYPFGIIVNSDGHRFVDEGADFRNYTYAKYGRAVLQQPHQVAWQVFDGKVLPLLREEYRIRQVTKVSAPTLAELAKKIDGIDQTTFLATVEKFNRSVQADIPFNPNLLDGRGTVGLAIPKSNWANPIDTPPFEAYAVTCGITFTFGGLRIDHNAQVISLDHEPIPGLFAAGELVGGLFYFNYPGGSGLTSGAVFGRIAGTRSAR